MLTVVGFVCLLIGTSLYAKFFKDFEYRSLVIMDFFISLIFIPLNYMLIFRKNEEYGIPDLALILFNDTVLDILS